MGKDSGSGISNRSVPWSSCRELASGTLRSPGLRAEVKSALRLHSQIFIQPLSSTGTERAISFLYCSQKNIQICLKSGHIGTEGGKLLHGPCVWRETGMVVMGNLAIWAEAAITKMFSLSLKILLSCRGKSQGQSARLLSNTGRARLSPFRSSDITSVISTFSPS